LSKLREKAKEIFVVTETVFSMDGDTPDLMLFAEICEKYKAHLILDEAHATGIFGESGKGLVFAHQLQSNVFARVHTFGKAVGCAGACVLGSQLLKDYLTNFGTGFIYTTAPAPLAALQIRFALNYIADNPQLQTKLRENINYFREKAAEKSLKICVPSNSAVQMIACETASEAKETSAFVRENGFDLRAILPPTARTPRLRVCLHAHNKFSEIDALTDCLQRRLSEK
jgi:8-amino-7-oxononanoate synthase